MGEANVAMARTRPPGPLGGPAGPRSSAPAAGNWRWSPAFEPGPATLCALALGPQSRWRLIASRMEIEDFGPLRGPAGSTQQGGEPCGDVRDWLTAYAQAGGPHHHAICFGDARPRLKLAAALLDADYLRGVMPCISGFDLGTTNVKAVVIDGDGRVVGRGFGAGRTILHARRRHRAGYRANLGRRVHGDRPGPQRH